MAQLRTFSLRIRDILVSLIVCQALIYRTLITVDISPLFVSLSLVLGDNN